MMAAAAQMPDARVQRATVACPTLAGTLFVDGIIRDTSVSWGEAWLSDQAGFDGTVAPRDYSCIFHSSLLASCCTAGLAIRRSCTAQPTTAGPSPSQAVVRAFSGVCAALSLVSAPSLLLPLPSALFRDFKHIIAFCRSQARSSSASASPTATACSS